MLPFEPRTRKRRRPARRNPSTMLAHEIAGNLASVRSVPLSILPAGEARDALMRWAKQGRDVYAYTSGGPHGVPVVWVEDERVALADWPAAYEARRRKGGYRI